MNRQEPRAAVRDPAARCTRQRYAAVEAVVMSVEWDLIRSGPDDAEHGVLLLPGGAPHTAAGDCRARMCGRVRGVRGDVVVTADSAETAVGSVPTAAVIGTR